MFNAEVDTNLESDLEAEKFPRLSQDGSIPTSERKVGIVYSYT